MHDNFSLTALVAHNFTELSTDTMTHFFSSLFAKRSIALLLLFALLSGGYAKSQKAEVIDLSILDRRNELSAYMSPSQRIEMLKAEKLIEEGQSEVRSGTYMVQRKPSALTPDEDLRDVKKQGEHQIEEGNTKISAGQKVLVELLTTAAMQQTEALAAAATKYNFKLPRKDYAAALGEAANTIIKACWSAQYSHIFFDGVRVTQNAQTKEVDSRIRNAAYDAFVKVDGTRFTVSIPNGLKLEDGTPSYTFSYENSETYKGDKIALLAVEIIAPTEGNEALLAVRAFEMSTQKLIASEVYQLSNASELFSANEAASTPGLIPDSVTIRDSEQWIDKLAALSTPYRFMVETSEIPDPDRADLLEAFVYDSISKNSNLILLEDAFLERAYLSKTGDQEAGKGNANAKLRITSTDEANTYKISAKANESGRVIQIGTITLEFSDLQ